MPPLINFPGVTHVDGVTAEAPYYFENIPMRGDAVLTVRLEDATTQEIRGPVVNTVPGAAAIQANFENTQWRGLANPALYAPYLRRAPLPGVPAKAVIFQFGKGDKTVVNPATTSSLRAGQLADRTLYFRNDRAFAEDPGVPTNPHSFMINIGHANALARSIARGAQQQIAAFFASDGKETIHPEPRRFFEVPLQLPLPEEWNYIP